MELSAVTGATVLQPAELARRAEALHNASRQLEALFTKQLLDQGGAGLPGTTQKDASSAIYGDLFRQAVADAAARNGSFGLSHQIFDALQRASASAPNPAGDASPTSAL